jgi:N-acetylglucosamine-6-phosphate deacetylase
MVEGRIAAIRDVADADDVYLSAGLVDLQVNGYAGIDLNDGNLVPDAVLALAKRLLEAGVTTFAPTLITASEATIIAGLRAIAEARRRFPVVGHMVPFAHVEGPSVAPEDGPRGAHPAEHVRAPSLEEFGRWQGASGNLVGMVTLSPHFPETAPYIKALTAAGVHVSIGHTAATPEQIRTAVDAGARLSTHLGNGAAGMLPRHPNFIWTQLADDRLTASFIADGHHLPADALRAMLRAKSLENAMLVSDAAGLGGMPPGIYEAAIGGRVEVSAEGRLGIPGTPYLAGAGHLLNQDVATAVAMAGLSLADGLRLATANPGRFAGGRGVLRAGASADLVRFTWAPGDRVLGITDVYVEGQRIAP